jgi:hypothetical protein
METITSDLLNEPNIAVPRLSFNRAFREPDEPTWYAEDKDDILNTLNNAISENPDGVLEDIAWLEDQLTSGSPIGTRSFIAINEGRDDGGWSAQRPYIGAIRDVLSITSNGSQFEFGHTPQQQESNWATIFEITNEIDREEIAAAQGRVFATQNSLRRARIAEADGLTKKAKTSEVTKSSDTAVDDAVINTEAEVAKWERLNTIAKQQRALIRLRALAILARGPELDIPTQATEAPADEVIVAARRQSPVVRAAGMLVRAAAVLSVF